MFRDYFYQTFEPSTIARQTGIYPCWTGELKAAENYHCRSRVLDDYFIIFINEGSGDLKSGTADFRLHKNDFFFLFPGIVHSYYTSKNNLLELSWIGFNGFLVNSLLKQLKIHPSNAVLRIAGMDYRTVAGMMKELIHAPADGEAMGRSADLLKIFSKLITKEVQPEFRQAAASGNHNGKVLRALAYIDSNYTTDISISELASHVNLSRSAFSRLFKAETGRSPQSCLIEIRLEQAVHLLSGNMPVKEVAHASGFNDEYYFSRCFKKHYGMSPNELRKNLKKISRANSSITTDKTWL